MKTGTAEEFSPAKNQCHSNVTSETLKLSLPSPKHKAQGEHKPSRETSALSACVSTETPKDHQEPPGSRRGRGREGDIQVPDYFPCEDPPAKGEIQGAESFFSFLFSLGNETKLGQDLKLGSPPPGLPQGLGSTRASEMLISRD